MTPPRTEPAGVAELVDAMLEFNVPITQALHHMVRAPEQPDPEEVAEVLKSLLRDVLAPLGTILAPRDLRTTTAVIEATIPLIVDNLYLVPHPTAAGPRRDPGEAHRGRTARSRPRRTKRDRH